MGQVFTSVDSSGKNVTITVKMAAGDKLDWWIRVTSKYDYGYGKGQGVGDYPWIVEIITGNTANYIATKNYKKGLYVAELNIMGIGSVDYSMFEITTDSGVIVPPPPVAVPQVSEFYWLVNDGFVATTNCTANPTDKITLRGVAVNLKVGQSYKAEFKFLLPTGTAFSFYSAYATATATTMGFTSQAFASPAPVGTYKTSWFVVYDSVGTQVCSGSATGSGLCENLTVSAGGGGGAGAGATINYSGFAKYNTSGCTEFSSCTVDPTVATGHVTIMNQVTILTAGTYTIRNTFRIGGTTYILTDSFSLSTGTRWVCCVDNGHDYAANMAYTHVEAVFV